MWYLRARNPFLARGTPEADLSGPDSSRGARPPMTSAKHLSLPQLLLGALGNHPPAGQMGVSPIDTQQSSWLQASTLRESVRLAKMGKKTTPILTGYGGSSQASPWKITYA